MRVTGNIPETFVFSIAINSTELKSLRQLANSMGRTMEDTVFYCMTSQAFISVVNT